MEKVTTIRLYGKLGAKFGRVHSYVVNSTRDALRALCAMVPGFEAELMSSEDRGIRYAVFRDKYNLHEKELAYPTGGADIRIAPVMVGRKAGLFQTIAGIALFVVGAVSSFYGNPYASQMMLAGASIALGGIAQMIAPHQTANPGGSGNSTTLQSYNFNGAQNTTYQGGPVPLLYGRMRVGSTVISEGLLAKDGTAQLVGGHYIAN